MYLQDGDDVTVWVDGGIGTLVNDVIEEGKGTVKASCRHAYAEVCVVVFLMLDIMSEAFCMSHATGLDYKMYDTVRWYSNV